MSNARLPNADDPALAGMDRLVRLRYLLSDADVPERVARMVVETTPHRELPTFEQMWAIVQRRRSGSPERGEKPR